MDYDITDKDLSAEGAKRLAWADNDMPVLQAVREKFKKEQPLKGMTVGACLHVTAETGNLMRTLKEGGANVVLCASNPLSTQDDIAATLVVDHDIPVFARKGEDRDTFFKHLKSVIAAKPQLTMDDGADLVSTIHKEHPDLLPSIVGGTEETTTGVIRLRAMSKDGALKFPIVAVNDAKTKNLFDNRYGTGQSTLDGIIRATDILLAGKVFVVAGYGWCGRGLAMRARGMGAQVIVTEIDPVKALEASMDGFRVATMEEAAPLGDVFCTATGNIHVIRIEHLRKMKDGAIVCNTGHFDVEIDVAALKKEAASVRMNVRSSVDEYMLGGNRINLLADGRLVNLAAAEGHPASVMDMSFSTQALACAWMATQPTPLAAAVYDVPEELENYVATLKLTAMGLSLEQLTEEQKKYLSAWEGGT
ncbi:MAG: adenosylhomocysteinase [Candidatus Pacebacteria bacterium]|nr:adenosylhomocysteinase [Candidatus Paceibacterota bacterium]